MAKVVDIKYLDERCRLKKGSPGAFAYDIRARLEAPVTIEQGKSVMIPTGVHVDTKEATLGVFMMIRSGMAAKHGLTLLNAVGLIDSDYRGEIMACVYNTGAAGKDYVVEPFERLGQVMFMRAEEVELNEVDELSNSERGEGGFGSTGTI